MHMYKVLAFCFFLYTPQPAAIYDSWWVMTGHNYGAPTQKIAVVKPCTITRKFDEAKFTKFCKNAGKYLKRHKGSKFCLRTGLLTKERCEDAIKQNIIKKRVIWRLIED